MDNMSRAIIVASTGHKMKTLNTWSLFVKDMQYISRTRSSITTTELCEKFEQDVM